MAMLVHGTRSVSVPTGNAGFVSTFPKVGDDVKFYTPEELEEMRANNGQQAESTWPGKKESSSEEDEEPSGPSAEEPVSSNSILGVVAKLATAPNDVNKEVSQANQDMISVEQDGASVVIVGTLADLNTFASTNPAQGEAKWIGLDIETKANSIVDVKWNGTQLGAGDVIESASVGLAQNHIIFWAKAEALPRTITLSAEGFDDAQLVVSFQEETTVAPD